MSDAIEDLQREVCRKHGVTHFSSPLNLKVGIALNVRNSTTPLNGLRHPPEGNTTGWYIWAGGELSADPDFLSHCMSSISSTGARRF
jgi:hypothetical protein